MNERILLLLVNCVLVEVDKIKRGVAIKTPPPPQLIGKFYGLFSIPTESWTKLAMQPINLFVRNGQKGERIINRNPLCRLRRSCTEELIQASLQLIFL